MVCDAMQSFLPGGGRTKNEVKRTYSEAFMSGLEIDDNALPTLARFGLISTNVKDGYFIIFLHKIQGVKTEVDGVADDGVSVTYTPFELNPQHMDVLEASGNELVGEESKVMAYTKPVTVYIQPPEGIKLVRKVVKEEVKDTDNVRMGFKCKIEIVKTGEKILTM